MPLRSLASWRRDRNQVPVADQILPIIAQRGAQGISRGELGRLVDLERDTLDALLDGFVRAGMLVLSNMNGVRIYRKADGSSQASALQLSNEPPSMLR
jgi:DNA-binding IclR family transcriptional regulator